MRGFSPAAPLGERPGGSRAAARGEPAGAGRCGRRGGDRRRAVPRGALPTADRSPRRGGWGGSADRCRPERTAAVRGCRRTGSGLSAGSIRTAGTPAFRWTRRGARRSRWLDHAQAPVGSAHPFASMSRDARTTVTRGREGSPDAARVAIVLPVGGGSGRPLNLDRAARCSAVLARDAGARRPSTVGECRAEVQGQGMRKSGRQSGLSHIMRDKNTPSPPANHPTITSDAIQAPRASPGIAAARDRLLRGHVRLALTRGGSPWRGGGLTLPRQGSSTQEPDEGARRGSGLPAPRLVPRSVARRTAFRTEALKRASHPLVHARGVSLRDSPFP